MTTISNSSRPVLGGNAQPVYVTNTVDLGGNAQPVYLTNGVNDLTGLEADAASAAASAAIVQEHFHNFERWYGASAGQIGPGVQVSGTPFRVTSSATSGTFGTAIVVLDGTEANASFQTLFDCHRIVLSDVSTATNVTYWLRLIFAVNGEETAAAAVANNHYTEIPIRINSTSSDRGPLEIMSGRIAKGNKVWAQLTKFGTVGAEWVEFFIGLHWYPARPPSS